MTKIKGKALVLPENVDTDQILSAEFMKIDPSSEAGRIELGALAFCGLVKGNSHIIDSKTHKSRFSLILAGENFGCGSSREHAPVALGAAGFKVVIAPSFARIFFRNCIVTGELLPLEVPDLDYTQLETGAQVEVDLKKGEFFISGSGQKMKLNPLGDVQGIIEAGGLFNFARKEGRIAAVS